MSKKIKKNIYTFTDKISEDIYTDLIFIFERYNSTKNYISNRYGSIGSYIKIFNHRKEIRDVWTKDGTINEFNIPKRYIRNAIEDTAGKLKANWTHTLSDVKNLTKLHKKLNDVEKHYIYKILKDKENLYNVLHNKSISDFDEKITIKFKGLNFHKLNSYIKRSIRNTLHNKPHFNKHTLMIDESMYSIKDGYFFLTGLKKGKRYKIKLKSNIKLNGNITIQLTIDKKLKISNVIDTDTYENDYTNVIGVDKNYINVFETSTDNSYGMAFNDLQNKYTNDTDLVNKRRQGFYNIIKESKDEKKIDKIKKNNLGKKKYNKKKNIHKENIEKHINKAIKELILTEKPKTIVVEDLSFTVKSNNKYNKKAKNKLSRFHKGIIRDRMDYICELYNVNLVYVNAAYTSQICSKCGHFGVRIDDKFHCQFCDKDVHSGFNAAKNVLDRLKDKDIKIFTKHYHVKTILQKRLEDKTGSTVCSTSLTDSTKTLSD